MTDSTDGLANHGRPCVRRGRSIERLLAAGGLLAILAALGPPDMAESGMGTTGSLETGASEIGATETATGTIDVDILRLEPEQVKPRAVVDAEGGLHLVYYQGDLEGGDLYYRFRPRDASALSSPLRVNTRAGEVAGNGLATSHDLALGREGRLHVAFYGSSRSRSDGPFGRPGTFHLRSSRERDRFEPAKNVRQATSAGPHGGQAVAADGRGSVWVTWYGAAVRSRDEAEWGLFVAHSEDEGLTFAPEVAVSDERLGACHCCSSAAHADARGRLQLLYRSAGLGRHRDMHLFAGRAGGGFADRVLDRWEIQACPSSGADLADAPDGLLAVFESSRRRLGLIRLEGSSETEGESGTPEGGPMAPQFLRSEGRLAPKMPVISVGSGGEVLVAWVEGVTAVRGGRARWQVYDSEARLVGRASSIGNVPANSLVEAVALADGSFLIIV